MNETWMKEALKIAHDIGDAMVKENKGECGPLSVSVEFARLEVHLRQAMQPKPIKAWKGPVQLPTPTSAPTPPVTHSGDPPMDES